MIPHLQGTIKLKAVSRLLGRTPHLQARSAPSREPRLQARLHFPYCGCINRSPNYFFILKMNIIWTLQKRPNLHFVTFYKSKNSQTSFQLPLDFKIVWIVLSLTWTNCRLLQASWDLAFQFSLPKFFLEAPQLSFGEGTGNPLQYSCLGNPMDGGAW